MSDIKLTLSLLAALFVVGCTQPTVPDPEPTDTTYGDSGSAGSSGFDDDGLGGGEPVDYDAGELPYIIYFDFDSSEVRTGDTDLITRHAMQLANNPGARVRLEGHADERGSREYNIGLGERRAQAVRRLLLIQGASTSQISTVSFGEERPQADGSTESAYALNRRVEIRYTN
ncbi:MAG: peptidoglycan-associated lipoprotein Pal [Woeseiaceae bacterium]|nr:peptidoglycan-associated lipoprotein Pal [Woeseiaceae bacterium]